MLVDILTSWIAEKKFPLEPHTTNEVPRLTSWSINQIFVIGVEGDEIFIHHQIFGHGGPMVGGVANPNFFNDLEERINWFLSSGIC